MKQKIALLLSLILFVSVGMQSVGAAVLSPALEHIAAESAMIKTGNRYTGVLFSASDFANAAGMDKLHTITVTSLPAVSAGTLYLGSVPIAVNQSISGDALDNLRFLPQDNSDGGSFCFSVSGGYSLSCILRITDEVNFAPQAVSTTGDAAVAWTQKNISCYGTLAAYDPENDAMTFEVVEYPDKGLLILTDAEHGDFKYTPYAGCSGSDSFTYRVRDSYGNYSAQAKATVQIARKSNSLVFSDMSEHWAHSAAIEVASAGIMDYTTVSGMPVFEPDRQVSREEFLAMVMKAMGYTPKTGEAGTVFADNDKITPEYRAYVSAAYNAGIVKGCEVDDALCFCPQKSITRAETAVMMNNIIGAEVPVNVVTFTDNDSVPTWAQSALYALCSLGVLKGTGAGSISPDRLITRAQAAQILFNFSRYLKQAGV